MSNFELSTRTVDASDWPDINPLFADRTYEQSLTYGQAAADRIGADAKFVVVESPSQGIRAAACIRVKQVPVLGRGIAWIVAGPMMKRHDSPDMDMSERMACLNALRDHVHAAGHVLRLRLPVVGHEEPDALAQTMLAQGFEPTENAPGYRTVVIDLAPSEEDLMKALHGKWRNPLRNAIKAGLELDIGPIADMAERFDVMFRDVQQSKGFQPDIGPEFFYGLPGPDFEHQALIAHKDGQDLAGFTLGMTDPNAVYLFGATTELGRRNNAGHFLMWQAALYCKSKGYRAFDLGGLSVEENPSVARFKLRTGGQECQAAGPFQSTPSGLASHLILAAEKAHKRIKAGG